MNHLLDLKKTDSSSAPADPGSPRRRMLTVLFLVLCLLGILWAVFRPQPWRAVFLSNDQVYFGKFNYYPFVRTVALKDVYYLQVSQIIQPASGEAGGQEVKIVKLGSELHGPKDRMVIPKSQILFYEDLREDSAVVKTIQEYKRQNP
jgi:hypothetical protein